MKGDRVEAVVDTGQGVQMFEIVVVFHAPFGPRRAKNSPAPASNEIPSTAFRIALPRYISIAPPRSRRCWRSV